MANDNAYVVLNASGTIDYVIVATAAATYSLTWATNPIDYEYTGTLAGTYDASKFRIKSTVLAWVADAGATLTMTVYDNVDTGAGSASDAYKMAIKGSVGGASATTIVAAKGSTTACTAGTGHTAFAANTTYTETNANVTGITFDIDITGGG